MADWFVVRCEGRKLERVRVALGGYVPTIERMTKPSRKKVAVVSRVPIFPGWVFAPFVPEVYRLVGLIDGVRGVMKYGRQGVLLLGDSDMEQLRLTEARMKALEVLPSADPSYRWTVGEATLVMGLLNGMPGHITRLYNQEADVDVGGNFPIRVPYGLLARARV